MLWDFAPLPAERAKTSQVVVLEGHTIKHSSNCTEDSAGKRRRKGTQTDMKSQNDDGKRN